MSKSRKRVIGLACNDLLQKDYFIFKMDRTSVEVHIYDYDGKYPIIRLAPISEWCAVIQQYPRTVVLDNRNPVGRSRRKTC
jgi:hypothetical protein